MRGAGEFEENAIFALDELFALGEFVIGFAGVAGREALAVGFVGGEIFDVVDGIRDTDS